MRKTLDVRGERDKTDAFLCTVGGVVDGEETPMDFDAIGPNPEEYKRADEVREAWDEAWRRRGSHPDELKDRPRDGFDSGGCAWREEY